MLLKDVKLDSNRVLMNTNVLVAEECALVSLAVSAVLLILLTEDKRGRSRQTWQGTWKGARRRWSTRMKAVARHPNSDVAPYLAFPTAGFSSDPRPLTLLCNVSPTDASSHPHSSAMGANE